MEPGNKSSAEVIHEGQPTPPQFEDLQGYSVPERTPEAGLQANPESELRQSRQVEIQAPPPVSAPGTLPIIQPPVNTDDAAATNATADDSVPLVAADEDLIEKEWVDKAKKIISETKDDPYAREQEVKKLQIEYVRKRYGRVIGDPGE